MMNLLSELMTAMIWIFGLRTNSKTITQHHPAIHRVAGTTKVSLSRDAGM